jgi:secondary thiamine-phosphate synthase enzyme
MPHHVETIVVETRGQGLYDISDRLAGFVAGTGVVTGLVTAFIRHTSASLTIQENADPAVQHDLLGWYARAVRENEDWYRHRTEGPDDMPAHIRASLTDVSVSIPVVSGEPALGAWQALYVFEHRAAPHRRSVVFHLAGD